MAVFAESKRIPHPQAIVILPVIFTLLSIARFVEDALLHDHLFPQTEHTNGLESLTPGQPQVQLPPDPPLEKEQGDQQFRNDKIARSTTPKSITIQESAIRNGNEDRDGDGNVIAQIR
jgi:hypothetical protein